MIDIHNFARFNGNDQIIGQGGPSDDQFVSLWTQLANKYSNNEKIVFELMNEPHDLDVKIWAATCQKVVTAIRKAGATSQMILLPGTNFDSAATLVSSGSADALMAITNPDGSNTNLLLDIHKYLDIDNSGTHAECITDNKGNFSIVADYLRGKGRKGFISETGASSQASCMTAFCAQNTFINSNADVFVGLVVWGAGSFDTSYVLSLTPSKSGNSFKDNALMSQCVLAPWVNSNTSAQPPASSSGPGASSSPGSTAAPSQTGVSRTMTLTSTGPAETTLITAGGPSPPVGTGGYAPSVSSSANSTFSAPKPTSVNNAAVATGVANGLLLGGIAVALFL